MPALVGRPTRTYSLRGSRVMYRGRSARPRPLRPGRSGSYPSDGWSGEGECRFVGFPTAVPARSLRIQRPALGYPTIVPQPPPAAWLRTQRSPFGYPTIIPPQAGEGWLRIQPSPLGYPTAGCWNPNERHLGFQPSPLWYPTALGWVPNGRPLDTQPSPPPPYPLSGRWIPNDRPPADPALAAPGPLDTQRPLPLPGAPTYHNTTPVVNRKRYPPNDTRDDGGTIRVDILKTLGNKRFSRSSVPLRQHRVA